MYGAEIYTHLAREVARESFVTNPIQVFIIFIFLMILLLFFVSCVFFFLVRIDQPDSAPVFNRNHPFE